MGEGRAGDIRTCGVAKTARYLNDAMAKRQELPSITPKTIHSGSLNCRCGGTMSSPAWRKPTSSSETISGNCVVSGLRRSYAQRPAALRQLRPDDCYRASRPAGAERSKPPPLPAPMVTRVDRAIAVGQESCPMARRAGSHLAEGPLANSLARHSKKAPSGNRKRPLTCEIGSGGRI